MHMPHTPRTENVPASEGAPLPDAIPPSESMKQVTELLKAEGLDVQFMGAGVLAVAHRGHGAGVLEVSQPGFHELTQKVVLRPELSGPDPDKCFWFWLWPGDRTSPGQHYTLERIGPVEDVHGVADRIARVLRVGTPGS